MYEAKLEFPEGWGSHRANPFHGEYGYFLELHNGKKCTRCMRKKGTKNLLKTPQESN